MEPSIEQFEKGTAIVWLDLRVDGIKVAEYDQANPFRLKFVLRRHGRTVERIVDLAKLFKLI